MLINALYLDEGALENYVAALEGGLRDSGSSVAKGGKGVSGSLGFGPARVDGHADSEVENTPTMKDHPVARLRRLIAAGQQNSEELAWIEVCQPEVDFSHAGIGSFIHWECDVYVPEFIAALANQGEIGGAIRLVKEVAPSAQALGLNMDGLPPLDQMEAMLNLVEGMKISPVVVGDGSETDWKVVGSLRPPSIQRDATFDGTAIIIGKVKKRIPKGSWYPLVSLPGMNLLGREERRRKERRGPQDDDEEPQFIPGPALVVDYLAIYT